MSHRSPSGGFSTPEPGSPRPPTPEPLFTPVQARQPSQQETSLQSFGPDEQDPFIQQDAHTEQQLITEHYSGHEELTEEHVEDELHAVNTTGEAVDPIQIRAQFRQYLQAQALAAGFSLVTVRSDSTKMILGCSRGGARRERSGKGPIIGARKTSSQQNSCPYQMTTRLRPNGVWTPQETNPLHNHILEPADNIALHQARRLLPEESLLVNDMTRSNCSPAMILSALQVRFADRTHISRDIYNARALFRRTLLAGQTPI